MSGKFQRRSQLVDAVQWFKLGDHPKVLAIPSRCAGLLATIDGSAYVLPGDWIVEHENGLIECVRRDDFEALYQPA